MFAFTQSKVAWLTAISSPCLDALGYLPQYVFVEQSHAAKRLLL